jgi:predicted ribosome quality control (RQC) complex YloA/Tae2 family protein
MRSDGLNPETLAKIAAQLNPQLACDDPAKAIELARNLLIAADPELAKQEADQAEEMQVKAEGQRHDELFPRPELISVAEAFKALPGHYKTETRFAAALRKENLTIVLSDSNEITTIRAVKELFRRQRKATQEQERERKAASKKKNQENVAESKGQKTEQIRRTAERIRQKAEATKQKAEASEST